MHRGRAQNSRQELPALQGAAPSHTSASARWCLERLLGLRGKFLLFRLQPFPGCRAARCYLGNVPWLLWGCFLSAVPCRPPLPCTARISWCWQKALETSGVALNTRPKPCPQREEGAAAPRRCTKVRWWSGGVGTRALQEDKPCRRTSPAGQALCCHAAVPEHQGAAGDGAPLWRTEQEGGSLCCSGRGLRATQGFANITGRRQNEQKINSLSICPEHKSSSLCYALHLGALSESSWSMGGKGSSGSEPRPNLGSSPRASRSQPQQRRGLKLSSSGRPQHVALGHISLTQPRFSRWLDNSPFNKPLLSHTAHKVSSPLYVPLLPHMRPGGRKQIFPIKTNHYALIHPSFGSSRCSWAAAGPSPSSAPGLLERRGPPPPGQPALQRNLFFQVGIVCADPLNLAELGLVKQLCLVVLPRAAGCCKVRCASQLLSIPAPDGRCFFQASFLCTLPVFLPHGAKLVLKSWRVGDVQVRCSCFPFCPCAL